MRHHTFKLPLGAAIVAPLAASLVASLAAAATPAATTTYTNTGPVPSYPLFVLTPKPRWTNANVDALVQSSVITIDAQVPASQFGAPAACDKVSFIRIKLKGASNNAEQADAALLMVPGVLEGAGAFTYFGKQLVYMASKAGKTIEVWGMDRRSNCLEDHTGVNAAESTTTSTQAEDLMISYYYKGGSIGGKTFGGFLKPSQTVFLSEFGMAQATQDMYSIIKYMMPTPGVSKRKAFLGGHSLGGVHVSTFLAWDFDGNAATTDDAGYNQVAGALGVETILSPVPDVPKVLFAIAPGLSNLVSGAYSGVLSSMRSGKTPSNLFIPGLIGPEVLALPTALGVFASKAPDAESTAIKKLGTLSPELDGFTTLMVTQNLANWGQPPHFSDFRFTNSALIGMAFAKNFTPLAFLQTGLGFVKGGSLAEKEAGLTNAANDPLVGPLVGSLHGTLPLWAPANAGPNLGSLGKGPLYGWNSREKIGSTASATLYDTTRKVQFTDLASNPANMSDFIAALHAPLDFTEWYFPMRILIDTIELSVPADAIKQGMNVYYPDGVKSVPSLVINGDEGLMTSGSLGALLPPQTNLLIAHGFSHLDPMFEAVASPSQVDYIMQPILDFMIKNTH